MEMVAVGIFDDNEQYRYLSFLSPHNVLSENRNLRYPYLFFLPRNADAYVTSCYGLLCFTSSDGRVVVCNPTTQQLQFLPPTRTPNPILYLTAGGICCGFGYDSTSQDYKVIKYSDMYRYEIGYDGSESFYGSYVILFELYSFRQKKWRNIPTPRPKPDIDPRSGSAFINGSFYWISSNYRVGFNILAFDFADETFSFISLPKLAPDYVPHLVKIGDASLGVVIYRLRGSTNSFELWVWRGEALWSVVYNARVVNESVERLLGLLNGRHLFFVRRDNKQLMVYDFERKELKEFGIYSDMMMFVSYVPSYVALLEPMSIRSYDSQEGWDEYWENLKAQMNDRGYDDVDYPFGPDDDSSSYDSDSD